MSESWEENYFVKVRVQYKDKRENIINKKTVSPVLFILSWSFWRKLHHKFFNLFVGFIDQRVDSKDQSRYGYAYRRNFWNKTLFTRYILYLIFNMYINF